MTLTRRGLLGGVAVAAVHAVAREADAALRKVSGGTLEIPLPAPRRTSEPGRAVDMSDVWPLALTHDTLATVVGDTVGYPYLAGAPVVDRRDPRVVTVTLRAGITAASGATVDARSLVGTWLAARSASPLAELVFAMCDTTAPFVARNDREIEVRVAAPGLTDEVLAAWPLSVTGAHGSGIGPFRTRAGEASLERNVHCPAGGAFVSRVNLAPPSNRNDELRGFVTGRLDGSWWGHALYDVTRPAVVVRGTPAGIVGMVPSRGGILDDPARARALEGALAGLSTGPDALLGPVGFDPGVVSDPTVLRNIQGIRLGRDPADGMLVGLSELVVARLDRAHVQVALVGAGDPADAVLRAVAPIGTDAALAVAAFLAVAGDPAGASVAARPPRAGRATVVAGAWGRGSAVVLGRLTPEIHVRDDVRGVRFDGMGRLLLGDAWLGRASH